MSKRVCLVCGVSANGINFCALTCQSCKAFFRRNAHKQEKYKCRFGDNCVITEESRKLCQKCRLKKCFAVGMKKEWILNEEEKEYRRQRIEENRKYREMCFNQASHDVPEVDKTVNSDSNANSWDDINNQQINEYINQIENYITNDESSDFHESIGDNIIIKPIIDGNNLDDKDICTDKILGHTGTTNSVGTSSNIIINAENNNYSIDQDCQIAIRLCTSNIMRELMDLNSFNEFECKRLNELFSGLNDRQIQLISERVPTLTIPMFNTVHELMAYNVINFNEYIEENIQTAKKLSGFKSTCINDQIALVKYSFTVMQILRAALYYNPYRKCWTIETDKNTSYVLTLDLLKGFGKNMCKLLKRVLNIISTEFNNDLHIVQLIMPILLFNPERPNLINRDMIELQQQLYIYLLQKYLSLKYGFACETKLSRISYILQHIHMLSELHKQNYLAIKSEICGPLLKEILE